MGLRHGLGLGEHVLEELGADGQDELVGLGEGAVSLCTWRRVLLYWDCTWKSVPPAESTTSVSREPWQSFSAEAKNVSWWSFHRRQKFSPILSNLHSAMARRLVRLEVVVGGGGWETGGGVNR